MEDSETKQFKDHVYSVLQNPSLQIIYTIANENSSLTQTKMQLLQQLSGIPIVKTRPKSTSVSQQESHSMEE